MHWASIPQRTDSLAAVRPVLNLTPFYLQDMSRRSNGGGFMEVGCGAEDRNKEVRKLR